jgi:glycogen operon protein
VARRSEDGRATHDDSFLLWLHAGADPVKVTLPGPPWALEYSVVFDTSALVPPRRYDAGAELELPGRCVVLLRAD